MTSVLLTVDTELSPSAHQRGVSLSDNFRTAILGRTSDGEWGLNYQIRQFNAHGLKAIFFVEALCAKVFGSDTLKGIVEPILSGGHEVQLHIHTEWLPWFVSDPVDGRRGRNMADFSIQDQCRLLEIGMECLVEAGAPVPLGFRAGNYGANNDTLRALARIGIRYDSSYNLPYLSGACRIVTDRPLLDAVEVEGVVELPIAFFKDYFQHHRPAQICANSNSELRFLIQASLAQKRCAAVIVSHSFELLNRARTRANGILVRRFERLCQYLGEEKRNIPTAGLVALTPTKPPTDRVSPLRSHVARTARRMMEQAIGALVYDLP